MSARADLRRAAPWVLCAVVAGPAGRSAACSGGCSATTSDRATRTGWRATIGALGFAGIPVVGALIASRLPANPYGWLWCAAGLAYGCPTSRDRSSRVVGWPALGGLGAGGLGLRRPSSACSSSCSCCSPPAGCRAAGGGGSPAPSVTVAVLLIARGAVHPRPGRSRRRPAPGRCRGDGRPTPRPGRRGGRLRDVRPRPGGDVLAGAALPPGRSGGTAAAHLVPVRHRRERRCSSSSTALGAAAARACSARR